MGSRIVFYLYGLSNDRDRKKGQGRYFGKSYKSA